ncbi:MAG: DUF3347 domain-containing protein [Deltaproteobacteria bacterium]|nr:DUF3347 domain-containing protein [Deltaproteobacteria bacterium]
MKTLKTLSLSLFATTLLLACSSPALAGGSKFDEGMKPILEHYLKAQEALAGDTTEGVQDAGKKIAKLAKKLDAKSVTGEHKEHFAKLPEKILAGAEALTGADTIEAQRDAFKKLSRPISMWTEMAKPAGVSVVFCSMAKGSWVQSGEDIRNPYYGAKMLACGEVISGAPAKGHSHEEMSKKK